MKDKINMSATLARQKKELEKGDNNGSGM